MSALLFHNLRHIVRTRLLFLILGFSFVIHYVGVKIVHSATLYFNGVISTIDAKDSLFISLVFQLFTAGFVSAVYGIWMVPYAHEGGRSALTFTLPLSKWKFPVVYFLCMLILLTIQHAIMLGSYGLNFGWKVFSISSFPWGPLVTSIFLETLAFETLMFGFALSAMIFGQVPTFFLGTLTLGMLQLAGVVFRFNWNVYFTSPPSFFLGGERLYQWLPPFGDLVVDMRKVFLKPGLHGNHIGLWVAWLLIGVIAFRLKLRYPGAPRSSD